MSVLRLVIRLATIEYFELRLRNLLMHTIQSWVKFRIQKTVIGIHLKVF